MARGGKRKGAGRPAKRGRKKKYKKKGSQWEKYYDGKIERPEVGRPPNPKVKNPSVRISKEEFMKRFFESKRK